MKEKEPKIEESKQEVKVEEEVYQVMIYFDKIENSVFGNLRAQTMQLLLPKSEADKLVEMYLEHAGILTINMPDQSVRYVNFNQILYLDVKKVK